MIFSRKTTTKNSFPFSLELLRTPCATETFCASVAQVLGHLPHTSNSITPVRSSYFMTTLGYILLYNMMLIIK